MLLEFAVLLPSFFVFAVRPNRCASYEMKRRAIGYGLRKKYCLIFVGAATAMPHCAIELTSMNYYAPKHISMEFNWKCSFKMHTYSIGLALWPSTCRLFFSTDRYWLTRLCNTNFAYATTMKCTRYKRNCVRQPNGALDLNLLPT